MQLRNRSHDVRNMRFTFIFSAILSGFASGCGGGSEALDAQQAEQTVQADASSAVPEDQVTPADAANVLAAPAVDETTGSERRSALAFQGGANAYVRGKFAPLHKWPVMPIAAMLTPDGRVLAYGTDKVGKQGSALFYTVWNPSIGTGADAFLTLPNTAETNIFCGGQALIPDETGSALLVGGEALLNKEINYANDEVSLFNPKTNKLDYVGSMKYKRWYSSVVTLATGEHVVLGGRMDKAFSGKPLAPATVASYASAPEVRATNGTWTTLSTASDDLAYGPTGSSWFYPRGWVNPQGGVFILTHNGLMFNLDTKGTGTLTKYKVPKITNSVTDLSSVMFAPGRVLSIRQDREATVVDFSKPGNPVVTSAGLLAKDRHYGNSTVLADGRVWVNGGSSTGNSLAGKSLDSELWNPATNKWTTTASATVARLYHSTSILLPDGRVLTGGGGAPGPENNLNGEIYYPPYLFKNDAVGSLAVQPLITSAPTTVIGWDKNFTVASNETIGRVTLVRSSAATHNFNNETRFFELPLPSNPGSSVTLRSPATANLAPPGYYMLFVWNAAGVPSVSKIVRIG